MVGRGGGEHEAGGGHLDGEANEGLDQPCCLLVAQRITAATPGGLNVELLQDLNGQTDVAAAEDLVRPLGLGPLVRAPGDRYRARRWCQRTARVWISSRSSRSLELKLEISSCTRCCCASNRANSSFRAESDRRCSVTSALTETPLSAARILASL